jgi:hypothetical protein
LAVETETTARRIAENQHAFREANERIEAAADQLEHDLEVLPFICECPQRTCVEIVRLKRHEYEYIRRRGDRFLVAPGHEITEIEGETVARLGQRFDRFSIMEKVGKAGERARELDPRGRLAQ